MSDKKDENSQVLLNGKPITRGQLEEKKKEVEKKTDVELVQVKENEYRTRIKG